MLKKSLLLIVLAVGGVLPVAAQDFPPIEIFGGLSVLSREGPEVSIGDTSRDNSFGWQFSGAVNLNSVLGIVADFGGHYEDFTEIPGFDLNANTYEYLFGPRFNIRGERAGAFVHTLIGLARSSIGAQGSTLQGSGDNAFLLGLGGGVDVNITESFGIRPIQFDWLPSRNEGDWSGKNVRIGIGVFYRFTN